MSIAIYKRVRGYFSTKIALITARFAEARACRIFFSAMLLPLLVAFYGVVVLPATQLKNTVLGETFVPQTVVAATPPELVQQHQLLALRHAFADARLQLARSDSVTLVLDLPNSRALLTIRGVMVRECPIVEQDISNALPKLVDDQGFAGWLAKPFELQNARSTTPKAPVVVKKAPKDTLEASLMNTQPVLPEKDDVYLSLQFSRNLRIDIAQTESPDFGGRMAHWGQRLAIVFGSLGESLLAISRGESPQHRPVIYLKMNREDARAIYRALPENGLLALSIVSKS